MTDKELDDRLNEIADKAFHANALTGGEWNELQQIAARLKPLVWSRERPTAEGWYWWRVDESGYACIAQVTRSGGGPSVGEWAGPIPQPGEVDSWREAIGCAPPVKGSISPEEAIRKGRDA